MEVVILIAAMVAVGLGVGWAVGLIWKGERLMSVRNEYVVAVILAIAIGPRSAPIRSPIKLLARA
jgi:hypothetical protein